MFKYIISWILVSVQSAPCPDANKVNEFGITNRSQISCAVYHTRTVRENKSKEFHSKDSAFVFLKNIRSYKKPEFSFSLSDYIESIKIDSVLLKK